MSTDAIKLALAALESKDTWGSSIREAKERAITALQQALAQPQQEPVGRLESDPDEGHVFVPRIDGDWSMLGEDLYTSPPARKPLTDEEIKNIAARTLFPIAFARAIEAKHNIKENT